MGQRWLVGVCGSVLLVSGLAHADPHEDPASASNDPVEYHSYRAQVIVADAVSTALLVTTNPTAAGFGAAGYLLAAPTIHSAHGESGRALDSFALRLGLPAVAGFGTFAIARAGGTDSFGAFLAGGVAGIVGAGVAMIIDDAVVAAPVPVRVHTARTWAPQVTVSHDRASFGVAGAF